MSGAPVYEPTAFSGSFAWGARPAVLVVDLTRGFTEAEFVLGAALDDVVEATRRLVAAARSSGAPVFYIRIAYRPDLSDAGAWAQKVPGLTVLVDGKAEADLDPRLDVGPDDLVITKQGASTFHGTGVAERLRDLRVDTVVIAGAMTSGCVRATVVDAVQENFPTFVVPECVGDRDPVAHDQALFELRTKYADFVALDEACARLAGAGAPRT